MDHMSYAQGWWRRILLAGRWAPVKLRVCKRGGPAHPVRHSLSQSVWGDPLFCPLICYIFCSIIDNVGIAGLHLSSVQRAKALPLGCAARSHGTCQHLSQAIFSGNVA